jgi:hypothetical protein
MVYFGVKAQYTRKMLGKLLFVVSCLISSAFAQTTTYAPFPASETLESKFGVSEGNLGSGCACAIGPNHIGTHFQAMFVAPGSVNTTTETPVSIRYDASGLCRGQAWTDSQGTFAGHGTGPIGNAIWQPGTIQDLPDMYGVITLSGYSQPTAQSVQIQVSVICADDGNEHCRNTCSASMVVPIVVKAPSSTGAEKTDKKQPAKKN